MLETVIATPTEQAALWALNPKARALYRSLLFCSKEAFYKAQYFLTGEWLEFSDLELEKVVGSSIQLRLRRSLGCWRLGDCFQASWAEHEGRVFCIQTATA